MDFHRSNHGIPVSSVQDPRIYLDPAIADSQRAMYLPSCSWGSQCHLIKKSFTDFKKQVVVHASCRNQGAAANCFQYKKLVVENDSLITSLDLTIRFILIRTRLIPIFSRYLLNSDSEIPLLHRHAPILDAITYLFRKKSNFSTYSQHFHLHGFGSPESRSKCFRSSFLYERLKVPV